MKWLEDKYRQRFKDASTTEDVNTDDLWSGIESALEDRDAPTPMSLKKWLLGLATVLGLMIVFCLFRPEGQSTLKAPMDKPSVASSTDKSIPDPRNSVEGKTDTKENRDVIEISAEENSGTTEIRDRNVNNTTDPRTPNIINTSNSSKSLKSISDRNTEVKSSSKQLKTDQVKNISTHSLNSEFSSAGGEFSGRKSEGAEVSSQNTGLETRHDAHINENSLNAGISEDINKTVQTQSIYTNETEFLTQETLAKTSIPISSLAFSSSELFQINAASISNQYLRTEQAVQRRSSQEKKASAVERSFSLFLYSGLNGRAEKTAGTDIYSQDINNGLTGQLGGQLGIGLTYHLSNNLYVAAGLEYAQMENRFSHELVSDTMIDHPSLQNQAKIRASNVRTVVQHNKVNYLSLPIELGIAHRENRWGFGAGLSLSYSILISQEGKLLTPMNNIIGYNNSTSPVYSNFFSVGLNPFIEYSLTDGLGLRLQVPCNYQILGVSEFTGLNHTAITVAPSLGLNISL